MEGRRTLTTKVGIERAWMMVTAKAAAEEGQAKRVKNK